MSAITENEKISRGDAIDILLGQPRLTSRERKKLFRSTERIVVVGTEPKPRQEFWARKFRNATAHRLHRWYARAKRGVAAANHRMSKMAPSSIFRRMVEARAAHHGMQITLIEAEARRRTCPRD